LLSHNNFYFTSVKIINKIPTNKTVLISPLDWGLGHATRCIPIIHALLKQQNKVFVCASDASRHLLESEFPNLSIIPIPGYNIRYSRKPSGMMRSLLFQLPKIAYRAFREFRMVKKIATLIQPDLIISDNRLGFRHTDIPSVYITHQLSIETGNDWLNRMAQRCHYVYLNKFDECWVPDDEGRESLAGKLSHPKHMPHIPVHYVGWLSRFIPSPSPKKHKAVIVLSGPEPQRTIFEKLIAEQLPTYPESIVLIRGLPGAQKSLYLPPHITVYNHLPGDQLCRFMREAETVIARAGYSTIMDLIAIQQKAILVPTPGQKEQEYLGEHLQHHRLFTTVSQAAFNLTKLLQNS
jgi:predicted glycosyltransferase